MIEMRTVKICAITFYQARVRADINAIRSASIFFIPFAVGLMDSGCKKCIRKQSRDTASLIRQKITKDMCNITNLPQGKVWDMLRYFSSSEEKSIRTWRAARIWSVRKCSAKINNTTASAESFRLGMTVKYFGNSIRSLNYTRILAFKKAIGTERLFLSHCITSSRNRNQ